MPRTNKRGTRRGGRNRKSNPAIKALKYGAVLAMPLAALAGGSVLAMNDMAKEKPDEQHCYERDDQYTTAMMVDFSTTPYVSKSQARDLNNIAQKAYDELPPNGKIAIFTTSNDTTSTIVTPDIEICKPARNRAELENLGAPTSSPAKIKRTHDEAAGEFRHKFQKLQEKARDKKYLAANSPILEQLQGISRASEWDRVYLYTDGVNNSAQAQFCEVQGHLPPFKVFETTPVYRDVQPASLDGAHVEFLMLQDGRKSPGGMKYCTWDELETFWIDYFTTNGASVSLTPLGVGAGR